MGGFFRSIFGGGNAASVAPCHPLPQPVETGLNRLEPVETDGHRFDTPCPIPTRRWARPEEHAAAILAFLQGPGGRTGSIPVNELKQLHIEICAEHDIEPIGWPAARACT